MFLNTTFHPKTILGRWIAIFPSAEFVPKRLESTVLVDKVLHALRATGHSSAQMLP